MTRDAVAPGRAARTGWTTQRGRMAGRWLDDADPLTFLLWQQSAVLTRDQTLRLMSPKWLRHQLRSGRWQTPHPGICLAHSGPMTLEQHRWVACLAAGPGALLAGATAAVLGGLRGHPTATIDVLIPVTRRIRRPPAGVIVHRTAQLTPADRAGVLRPPRTMMARALVDAAAWALDTQQSVALIMAGVQQHLVTCSEFDEVLGRLTRLPRRAVIRQAVEDARVGAHSLPEALFIRALRRAGLPVPALQVRRRDARGSYRYLDGYYERWKIHIEIDGGQHMEVGSYWADMRRQNALWVAGDRVLRFPSWAVRHQTAEVIAQVRAALLTSGWSPAERA